MEKKNGGKNGKNLLKKYARSLQKVWSLESGAWRVELECVAHVTITTRESGSQQSNARADCPVYLLES